MHAKLDVLRDLPAGGCCGVGGLRGAQRLGRGESAWAYAGVGKIRSGRRLVEGSDSCGPGSLVVRVLWRRLRVSPRFQWRERERSRERLRCAGIALEPETWRCVCFVAVSGCVVIAVAVCIALRAAPAVFVFVVCGAGLAGCGGLQLYLRSKRQRAAPPSMPDCPTPWNCLAWR